VLQIRPNAEHSEILDVLLVAPATPSSEALELSLLFYPYARTLDASAFSLSPFEEYARDVGQGRRSLYAALGTIGDNVFGVLLGAAIALVFVVWKPTDIASVQSVVSIFAAYAIGKEIWNDVDRALVGATAGRRLRWVDQEYFFVREHFSTMQRMWQRARVHKYQQAHVLPTRFDFVTQSSSKLVELCLTAQDLAHRDGEGAAVGASHLASIQIKPEHLAELHAGGFMIGVKIAVVQKIAGLVWARDEYFQSLDRGELGALDDAGVWHAGAALKRRTLQIGRVKWYRAREMASGMGLIELK